MAVPAVTSPRRLPPGVPRGGSNDRLREDSKLMKMTMKRATTFVAALALAGTTALVAAPGASAAPAAGAFSTPTISGLSTVTLPAKGSKDVAFKVSFSGTASDGPSAYSDTNGDGAWISYKAYDANFYGATIVKTASIAKKAVYKPYLYDTTNLVTGTNGGFSIRVYYFTTPGVYRVTVPVTQVYYPAAGGASTKTTRTAVVSFTVKANTKYSRAGTRLTSPGWRTGQTAKLTVTAPEYQAGGKVTLYIKKHGKKKYAKSVSGKLKRKGSSSKVTLKKKGLSSGDKIYFKIGKVKYAAAYKTKNIKIKRIY